MGLALVWKPAGPGSQDYLKTLSREHQLIRSKKKGRSQIGHSGTLDPFAEGVLVVGWQEGTKLISPLVGADKTYVAEIVLGQTTETLDSTSSVLEPPADQKSLIWGRIQEFLKSDIQRQKFLQKIIGTHNQVPPRYSALKIDGQRAYSMARSTQFDTDELDKALAEKKRVIQIYQAQEVSVQPDLGTWTVRLGVSSGTYIRSLARDFSQELVGFPGYLKTLVRESVGPWELKPEQIFHLLTLQDLGQVFNIVEISPESAQLLKSTGRYDSKNSSETPKDPGRPTLLVDRQSQIPVAWVKSFEPLEIGRVFVENPL